MSHPTYTADGDEIPACEICDDNGEVQVAVGRDSFGVWDTRTERCSCDAGLFLALPPSSRSRPVRNRTSPLRGDPGAVPGKAAAPGTDLDPHTGLPLPVGSAPAPAAGTPAGGGRPLEGRA